MRLLIRLLLARFFYMWGSLHRHFGNRSAFRREHLAALRCFNRACDLDPNLLSARLDRGILLWRELGKVEEGLADFNHLLAGDPAYGPALLNRAMVYQEIGQYQAALSDLEAYLALPVEDETYYQIAGRTADLLRKLLEE